MRPTVQGAMTELDYVGGPPRPLLRELAVECPVAIEVNGVAYAVMMATPDDLEDYAVGFALSEGLIDRRTDLIDLAVSEIEHGVILRLSLSAEHAAPLLERVRMRVGEGSCGLCGLESIEAVLRPLPRLTSKMTASPVAVQRALSELGNHQTGGRRNGAMHAAAFCTVEGDIVLAREDVGRHNALDKLIGAMARLDRDPASGFMLVSARCSYELVEKAVRAGCPMLVAISAPTSLAVERARAAGLTLVALARHDTMLVLAEDASQAMELAHGL